MSKYLHLPNICISLKSTSPKVLGATKAETAAGPSWILRNHNRPRTEKHNEPSSQDYVRIPAFFFRVSCMENGRTDTKIGSS